jgi:hypothetical protein
MLLYTGQDADETTDEHEGYVSGQRADGSLTTIWTALDPDDDGPFVAYFSRCECGWTGPALLPTPAGQADCEHLWQQHLCAFLAQRQVPTARWSTPVIDGIFVPEL